MQQDHLASRLWISSSRGPLRNGWERKGTAAKMRAVVPRRGKQTRCTGYQTCWYSSDSLVGIADEDPSRSDHAHIKYREAFYLRTLYRRKFLAAAATRTRLLIRRRVAKSLNFVLSKYVVVGIRVSRGLAL